MKLLKHVRAIPLIVSFFLIITCLITEKEAYAYNTSDFSYIYDDADIINSEAEAALIPQLEDLAKKNHINFYILTSDDLGSKSSDQYIEDFDKSMLTNPNSKKDCVVLLVYTKEREVTICGFGKCKRQINSSRGKDIINDIGKGLCNGSYQSAFELAIKRVNYYMNKDVFYFQSWFQLLVGAVISLIIILIMAINVSGRVTTNSHTYLDESSSLIRAKHDNYIRTVVTKTKKTQNNNNSHGGGSSGGRSHSSASGHY